MIKIAIPTCGNGGLNEIMNNRFGRCDTFTLVTIENNQISEVESVINRARDETGGVGIQAAQIIGNHNANEVIVDFLGPNAAFSLKALNIKIYHTPGGELTVKELIDLRLNKKLQLITSANVGAHQGMGRSR
ncbi:MAG TPA: NifB/NifX family molybdenum-iron cluster-binding protein [Candidatus Nanopelagicaceae bacterium]|nr:NifB/NifX family molybdenum-iron cluster-binding protein [Candidatus Nanopelagicaceae bacterium]